TPNAQHVDVQLTGRVNGTYVYTGELSNLKGTTATTSVTVKVTDANPGKPFLFADNGDGNGSYTVTAVKWWGTPATTYRLYEDGVLIDTQAMSASAGLGAQWASTTVTGRRRVRTTGCGSRAVGWAGADDRYRQRERDQGRVQARPGSVDRDPHAGRAPAPRGACA
ncbi:MAG TPA: hypothetical protein VIK43_05000, partial [Cellulomonas sp.]